tara:strand:- start:209174 stop:209425 length:252 start_codon:yes stop_codon:yes gene_type:complete
MIQRVMRPNRLERLHAHEKTLLVGYDKKGFKNPAIPTFTLVGTIIGPESLTAVFEMGTGRTFLVWSPERHTGGYFTADAPVVW